MQGQDHLSSQKILSVLVGAGLLSRRTAAAALKKEASVKAILEAKQEKIRQQSPEGVSIETPVNFIDVLLALKISREDRPRIILDGDALYEALARSWGFDFKKIDPLKLDLNLVTRTIPRNFAMKHLLLPLEMADGKLVVATPEPFNQETFVDVERVTNLKVKPVVSPKADVIKLIDEFFGFRRSISAAEDQFSRQGVDLGNLEQYVRLKSSEELPSTDQHIVNAVNHLFVYAFDQRASDIHIEPKRDTSLVRMRIDGVLHTVYKLPKKVHNAVVSRIKTLSRLDMAEKRRPQDGRRPHGIILVTGPTGSGKSTTLYSTLRRLSSPQVNITTIEDPIEMIHEDFNQISVQPAIDITFDNILRNILRQDPDIIMVGEIRDLQTAQSAVQAALTGHLVLSTLHTNDSVSTITRLLDLGIPPFLIHSSLVGLVAQRLVRRICPNCSESFEMDAGDLRDMGLDLKRTGTVGLKRGRGCVKCRNTGYKGREGVFEVLPYSESLKKMTSQGVNLSTLRKRAEAEGLITLRENAVTKMLAGETTYQEVLRVTWENE